MFTFELVIFLIALGLITGFFSGLLGIGGGTIVVPGLAILFHNYTSEVQDSYMQFAAGSSLAVIIFSSISSYRKNLRVNAIYKPILRTMTPWIILFVIIGAVIAFWSSSEILSILFCLLLLYLLIDLLIRMFKKNSFNKENNPKFSKKSLRIGASAIGFVSGLLGLGGGIISVPFFNKGGLSMRMSAGTSSYIALVISISGAIIFALIGYLDHINIQYTTGFIYWPAVLLIIPFAIISAPYGIKLRDHLSNNTICIIFILYLILVIIKMLSLAFVKIF